MARVCRICWILFAVCFSLASCQKAKKSPPSVPGTFQAIGEMVLSTGEFIIDDPKSGNQVLMEFPIQVMFEENYWSEKNESALKLWQLAQEVTFIEDLQLEQTFKYDWSGCKLYPRGDWINAEVPPAIKVLETSGNKLFFPLRQIFTMNTLPGVEVDGPYREMYRDIEADVWKYTIKKKEGDKTHEIEVDEFWSVEGWHSSSPDPRVPLGFNITRRSYNSTEDYEEYQFLTITHFVNNSVDERAMQVKEGIFCDGRKGTRRKFPDFKMLKFFTFGYEFVVPANQEAKNGRTWMDIDQKLMRVDYDPFTQRVQSNEKYFISRIFSFQSGLTYEIGRTADTECKVMINSEVDYDPQIIYNIQVASQWSEEGLFGIDRGLKYYYIGESNKRGIPCSLWQGQRNDWPPNEEVTSIWEWCFANIDDFPRVVYEENTYPLVALTITITNTPEKTTDSGLYKGLKMNYHFYDIHTNDNGTMLNEIFDLSPCYTYESIYELQFTVIPFNASEEVDFSGAPMDPKFNRQWMNTMYYQLALESSSLLLQDFRTIFIGEKKKAVVLFTLLDPLDILPEGIKWKDRSKEKMMETLKTAINGKLMRIQWTPRGRNKPVNLTAEPESLDFQPGFRVPTIKVTTTPLPPKSTTKSEPPPRPGTLRTTSTIKPESTPFHPEVTEDHKTTSELTDKTTPGIAPNITDSTDNSFSTTPQPDDNKKEKKKKLKDEDNDHVSGNTVAGVVIGVLLGGIGLGAAGTFAKVRIYDKRTSV